ncbi:Shedu anti-phage system protein SduA domain-containing protein [Burkholderia vietnamiensis]|uniref:Shedu anti-phage system protein SduA domain-containing protein n=1 Tax=Burkholderia vietnamiensis TaxID=60552 RepID=UPI0009C01F77|nr:Shedu anti-phage system protein SduA domain-containing protein [Burkholderia vietnamiensis]
MASNINNEHEERMKMVMPFMQGLMVNYSGPLYHYVKANPDLQKTVAGFLINPEKIILYIGRTHIGVEYVGSEVLSSMESQHRLQVEHIDYSLEDCNILEKIIGFSYDSSSRIMSMPLPPISEDLLFPTNRGWDKLFELGWNVSAQNSLMGFNAPCPEPMRGQLCRIVNGWFFDANDAGLKTRHIKWLDLFPIGFDGSDDKVDSFTIDLTPLRRFVEHDANYIYPVPSEFKYAQLPKINRFIEVWGDSDSRETDITGFLSRPENEFILTMRFGAQSARAELLCEWQSEERKAIKPDFFVVQSNGYADIVEFKLPDIGKKTVTGSENREAFAAWLNSYIAQTRVYATYFDDPNNRRWFEEKYGFKVYKPRRWLIVGRRSDFTSEIWREIISDYRDLEILTFDDLIDGVVAQFYKK